MTNGIVGRGLKRTKDCFKKSVKMAASFLSANEHSIDYVTAITFLTSTFINYKLFGYTASTTRLILYAGMEIIPRGIPNRLKLESGIPKK